MAPTALNPAQAAVITALGLLALALGWLVYSRVVAHLRITRGAVRAELFDLPELLVTIVLATFFSGLVIHSAMQQQRNLSEMTGDQVLPSSLMFVAFVVGLSAFLSFRGLRLADVFGLKRVSLLHVGAWALLLLLAAFPFVGAANAVSILLLRDDAAEQPLVKLFRAAAQRGDYSLVGNVILAGVIIAPLCEEFLFRGFFYGVGKRYVGAWISGLATALLFAAFHASLTSLPGLFVLAVAFTLAYERTGSLFVPITMHALFNATSLGILYLQALQRVPA